MTKCLYYKKISLLNTKKPKHLKQPLVLYLKIVLVFYKITLKEVLITKLSFKMAQMNLWVLLEDSNVHEL